MIDLHATHSDKFIGTTAAIVSALAAAGTAGATIYGAKKAGEANELATNTSAQTSHDAIEEQKRQDAQQQAQFEAQQAAQKAQWDAMQQIRAPYRQAGATALMKLGSLLGSNFGPQIQAMTQPRPYVPPPANQPVAPTVKMNALMPQSVAPPRYPVQP